MLVGACYTLFRMRKSLGVGMKRAISDLKKSGQVSAATNRTERDLNPKIVFGGLALVLVAMIFLYNFFAQNMVGAIVAAVVMIILGFFFAAVSGNLVGTIGSSNNPISGLTLATLIIAALLMVSIGVKGPSGVAAVLGVAAVVCVSSAVAGEMLQDLKVGHILGGTPRSMQLGDFLGVIVASFSLFFVLMLLHVGNIRAGGIGFGDRQLSAPQAGLMAMLSRGIVGGEMAWPLIVVGILMGVALIMMGVRSPMLFAVGMYLPLETTFAIFVGGVIRWLTDVFRDRAEPERRAEGQGRECRSADRFRLYCRRGADGHRDCRLPLQAMAGAGHLQRTGGDLRLHRADHPGRGDDHGAVEERWSARTNRHPRPRSCSNSPPSLEG